MQVAVEISLYPLTSDYEPLIVAFIKQLQGRPDVTVATNPLSTQLSGEYDVVMPLITGAMRSTLGGEVNCSFVLKILNVEIEPGRAVEI